MKHLLFGAAIAGCLLAPLTVPAWDGFDAATTDRVEIRPDRVPAQGDTVDVRNYDTDASEICLVESVTRNARTVEVVVSTPKGLKRTLVMEGR